LDALRVAAGQPLAVLPVTDTKALTTASPSTPSTTISTAAGTSSSSELLPMTTNYGGKIMDVWVHFGVDSKATEFRIENRAANGSYVHLSLVGHIIISFSR
jgi:hypothetical protein